MFIEVPGSKNIKKTIIAAIYRAPNTDFQIFNKEFEKVLQIAAENNTKCILAGDFNVNLLKQSHSDTGNFIDMLFSYSILPEIKAPTRYGDSSMTLIDNIFTNKSCNSHISGVILHDISDHLPIFYITGNMVFKQKKSFIYKQIRVIDNDKLKQLSTKLSDCDWSDCDNNDPDIAFESVNDKILELYNYYLPMKTIKVKIFGDKEKPWLSHCILKSVKTKNKLYRKFLEKKSPETKSEYIKFKNILTSTIRKSERLYYAQQFELKMNNTRATWNLINSIIQTTRGIKTHNPIIINCDDEIIKDSNTIANKFNVFFSSIGSLLASNIPSMKPNDPVVDYMPHHNTSSMYLFPCSNVELENIVRDLSNTKSIGLDGFSMKVIKSIISNISVP